MLRHLILIFFFNISTKSPSIILRSSTTVSHTSEVTHLNNVRAGYRMLSDRCRPWAQACAHPNRRDEGDALSALSLWRLRTQWLSLVVSAPIQVSRGGRVGGACVLGAMACGGGGGRRPCPHCSGCTGRASSVVTTTHARHASAATTLTRAHACSRGGRTPRASIHIRLGEYASDSAVDHRECIIWLSTWPRWVLAPANIVDTGILPCVDGLRNDTIVLHDRSNHLF